MTSRARKKKAVRTRPGLTRARILGEALTLLDREGVEALTIRRLADRLGVSPMALYNHVADKQDLLQSLARTVIEGAQFADTGGAWDARVTDCFRELRRICLAHPWIVKITQMPGIAPPAVFQPMNITLAALAEIGIAQEDGLRAFFLLINFVLGQVSYEIEGPYPDLEPAHAVHSRYLSGEERARLEPAAMREWDFDAAFQFGLSVILMGLACRARAGHAGSSQSGRSEPGQEG